MRADSLKLVIRFFVLKKKRCILNLGLLIAFNSVHTIE